MMLEEIKDNYIERYSGIKLVFGEGIKDAKIMLVGEAPGANEEKQGRPFVGVAGKNLDEFLKIVGLERQDIYITNVVKLRPSKNSPKTGNAVNRPPTKEEIEAFLPLLEKEIEEINPKFIVTLGNVPLKAVTKNQKITIGDVHGQKLDVEGKNVLPLYHPASIIYNRSLKETYLEDLTKIKDCINN